MVNFKFLKKFIGFGSFEMAMTQIERGDFGFALSYLEREVFYRPSSKAFFANAKLRQSMREGDDDECQRLWESGVDLLNCDWRSLNDCYKISSSFSDKLNWFGFLDAAPGRYLLLKINNGHADAVYCASVFHQDSDVFYRIESSNGTLVFDDEGSFSWKPLGSGWSEKMKVTHFLFTDINHNK